MGHGRLPSSSGRDILLLHCFMHGGASLHGTTAGPHATKPTAFCQVSPGTGTPHATRAHAFTYYPTAVATSAFGWCLGGASRANTTTRAAPNAGTTVGSDTTNSSAPPITGTTPREPTTGPRGIPVYSESCFRCGTHVPQRDTTARVCDVPRCVAVTCARCHPDVNAVLECPEHQGRVAQITGRDGNPITLVASVPTAPAPEPPPGSSPHMLVLFSAITVLLAATVATAAIDMQRAWNFFTTFMRFYNITPAHITPFVVMAYILCRCNPPPGIPLPSFMSRRVLPKTAAGDIGLLRRRARLMKDHELLAVLTDEDVLRLGSVLGANVKKSKTDKAPVLVHHLQSAWNALTTRTLGALRNMALLVLGLIAGLRRREITALRWGDVAWSDDRQELVVSIRRDKTNNTVTDAQHPRTLVVSHSLLTTVWKAYTAAIGHRLADSPLFPRIAGNHVTSDHLEPSTINSIVRQVLPGLPVSPHSLRVGFATELHAAGTPLPMILELGRWSSLTGLLYVLPSADNMTSATRSMGSGAVSFDRAVLQRSLNAGMHPPTVRRQR